MWLLCARHCHRIYICIFIHRFVKIAVYIVLSFYLRMLILFLLILYLHSKLFLLPSQSRTSNLLAFLICIPFFFFFFCYTHWPLCPGNWNIHSALDADEYHLCKLVVQLMVSDSIQAIGMMPYVKAIVTGLLENLEAICWQVGGPIVESLLWAK